MSKEKRNIKPRSIEELVEQFSLVGAITKQVSESVIATNLDFEIIYANRAFRALYGYTEDEVNGRSPDFLNVEPFAAEIQKEIYETVAAGKTWRGETLNRRKDGSTFTCELAVSPLVNETGELFAYAGTQKDITSRRVAEEALRESERKSRAIFDQTFEFIGLLTPDGTLIEANRTALDFAGLGADEVLERPFWETVWWTHSPDLQARLKDAIRDAAGGQVCRFEASHPARDGKIHFVDFSLKPVKDEKGDVVYLIPEGHDITERKQTELALKESENRFQILFNDMLEAFALHEVISDDSGAARDYRFISVNRAFEEITGLKGTDIVGKTVLEILPDTEPSWIDTYGRVCATGESIRFERYSRALNRYFQVGAFRPTEGQFATVFTDITEQKQAEESLKLTQYSVDKASDAAYWMRPDARFIYVNEAACHALGYSRDELLTMTVHDIGPDFPVEVWTSHWEDLKERKSFLIETTHQAKDGREFPVEISLNYVEFGGKEFNIAFARDMTERKQANEEKMELARQVQQAQKQESLGVLAGGIAHDFNNLLMGILGHADLALHTVSPMSPVRRNLQEIEKASQRAAELSNQMLAYSGKGRFNIEAIDAGELVKEIAHLLEASVSTKAKLRYDLADAVPTFDGDVTQVRQIVMSLILNASEAIGEGSGTITLHTATMDCDRSYLDDISDALRAGLDESLPEGVYTFIEVIDTGCGMDTETLGKIFDPFFTTKFTGRGLGMSAALGIMLGHKGAIKIHSEVGVGTTVRVLFPANAEPDCDEAIQEITEIREVGWRGSGTVLLVDDEETVREVGKQMLEHLGFCVRTATDGQNALRIFRDHTAEITCVLLDLTMPHMDGVDAFDEMRSISPAVTVILTSGYKELDATHRFAGKGLAGFIQKPFRLATLRDKLRGVLERK